MRKKQILEIKTIIPGSAIGAKVLPPHGRDKRRRDQALGNAIRTWKQALNDSGKLDELKIKQAFEKPSEKKRRMKNAAIYNRKKNLD